MLSVRYYLGFLFHSERILLLLVPAPPPATTPTAASFVLAPCTGVGLPSETPAMPMLVVVKLMASTGSADGKFPGLFNKRREGNRFDGDGNFGCER